MNKQEKIKKLESIKAIGNDAIAACYNESMNAGITLIKKIDEPQKHVMPKFFDKWAKQVLEKRDKFYAISLIARAGWGYGVDYELDNGRAPSGTKELLNWLVENEGDDYPNKKKATEALLYGYEVEKEPLYRVKIGEGYFVEYQERGALIIPDGNKEIKIFDSKSDAERTAQTIGGTVEEVAEG
ncbi:TPA: DUF1642 domain-containing protein [Enterococcus faecium]